MFNKKSIFLSFLIVTLISSFSFALDYFNFNYYCSFENRNYLIPSHKDFGNYSLFSNTFSPAGLEINYTHIFKNKQNLPFNPGITGSFSSDFFDKATISTNSEYADLNFSTGYNLSAAVAATAKYDFNEKNFVSGSAGLKFSRLFGQTGTLANADPYINLRIYDIKLDLNAGYTYLFYSTNKISLGLNAGIDFAIPLFGLAKYSYLIQNKAESFNESYYTFGTDAIKAFAGFTLLIL